MPHNYHLTFEDETTDTEFIKEAIKKGGNVAVVFDEIPKLGKAWKLSVATIMTCVLLIPIVR